MLFILKPGKNLLKFQLRRLLRDNSKSGWNRKNTALSIYDCVRYIATIYFLIKTST